MAITDRREELVKIVREQMGPAALGESFTFELVPVAVPTVQGGMEIAYLLVISTRSPLIGGGHITNTSQPFTWMAGPGVIEKLVPIMIREIREHVAGILRNNDAPESARSPVQRPAG